MIDTRFSTTRRSTPATSTPCLKAPSTAARMPNRNSATANEPAVSAVRVFLRNRLLTIRWRYFIARRLRCGRAASLRPARRRGLDEHPLLQMEDGARAVRGERVVGDHQRGLSVIPHEAVEQIQDLIGALAVEVAGGLVAEQKGRIGDDRPRDPDPLLLPARELARIVTHAVAQADDLQSRLDVTPALRLRQAGKQERELHVLERGEHGNQVVHLEDEPDVARAPRGQLAGGHVRQLVTRDGDTAGRGHVEAAEQIEQGGLAGAARAHECHEVAGVDVEVQSLQHVDLLATAPIDLAEPARSDQALAVSATVDTNHQSSLRLDARRPARDPAGRGSRATVGYFFTRTDWPSRSCLAPVVTT